MAIGGGKNLASKYSKVVDERFARESQAMMALNNNYDFTGVDTVKVYSIPVVPMTDYQRVGLQRYGVPDDLQRNVQTMKITKDRAFTFIIDKGDKIQSMMVSDAGKALQRQLKLVWVPEYDTYVFRTLAASATAKGNFNNAAITKANAYEMFLKGMEALGNNNVPDDGRVAFCSYGFANLLKQDPAFMKYSNLSQEMIIKGVLGEVDGCKIVKVPSSRLPAGAAFLITHPIAATGPKQLEDYKIHDNPPGVNGWLVEGRVIYDCFVLNEKACAIYYHGSQEVLQTMQVITAPGEEGKMQVILEPGTHNANGAKWYAVTKATAAELPEATYGTAITVANWTEVTANGAQITPVSGATVVRVVEVDSANKPIAVGTGVANF
jgi:N4-gp56 family major capsid protein